MRFALLCDDPSARPLIDAMLRRVDGHQLTDVVRLNSRVDTLMSGQPGFQFLNHWEDLLVDRKIDAVLAGGTDPDMLEGLKQLAAAGIPALFISDAGQTSTYIYELSLIQDDNHVPLFPLFWHRFDRGVTELKNRLADGRLGSIQYLQLNRRVKCPSPSTPIPQTTVDAALLQDTDLLRWLVGDYDQVTALRTGATDDGVLVQNVVLSGRSLPESNWSISPADDADDWRLTVRCEQGTAELLRDDSSREWVCQIDDQRTPGSTAETARAVLAAFAQSVSATNTLDRSNTSVGQACDWGDLVKCFETVDATHRSIRRRRTIELHFEPMSERAIFKTQMTAIGCGLLVGTLLLMLCYLVIASVVPLPQTMLVILRFLVFAPLLIFLIAQFLLPLTRRSSSERIPTQ